MEFAPSAAGGCSRLPLEARLVSRLPTARREVRPDQSRLASAARALRLSPGSLARDSGVCLSASANASGAIARNSRANARASDVANDPCGVNAGSVAARENLAFHGQTSWEVCRRDRFEISLGTGARTLWRKGAQGDRVDVRDRNTEMAMTMNKTRRPRGYHGLSADLSPSWYRCHTMWLYAPEAQTRRLGAASRGAADDEPQAVRPASG